MSAPNYYRYKGEWHTLSELALQYNVNIKTLQSRMRCGWSVARAIETPSKPHRFYKYKDKLYSVVELARLHGDLSPHAIQARLDSGMSVEDAVTKPKQKGIPYSVNPKVKKEPPKKVVSSWQPHRSAEDIKKCKKCRYSEKDSGGYTICMYIVLSHEHKRRGCKPGKDCKRFDPRTKKTDRVKMAGSGWIREAR